MQLAVVRPAKRYGELITDLLSEPTRLRKAQVVRIGRLASANQTRLLGQKPKMLTVAQPLRLGDGERVNGCRVRRVLSTGGRFGYRCDLFPR
jgi:hypothetical protein